MYIVNCGKDDLKDFIENTGLSFDRKSFIEEIAPSRKKVSGKLLLVWFSKYRLTTWPNFIVVGDEAEKVDILAWLNTYSPVLRPITAYISVITLESLIRFENRELPEIDRQNLSGAIGLILAESAYRAQKLGRNRTPSMQDARETLSFCFYLGILRGCSVQELRAIFKEWRKVERYRNNDNEYVDKVGRAVPNILCMVSGVNLSDYSTDDLFENLKIDKLFVDDVKINGTISKETISSIQKITKVKSEDIKNIIYGTREERVQELDKVINKLFDTKSISNEKIELIIGLLVSQASPGAVDYLHFFTDSSEDFLEISLWYGLFSGLYPGSKIALSYGAIGMKILSEMDSLLTDMHTLSSIDVIELELLRNIEKESFIEYLRSIKKVELAPGVITGIELYGNVADNDRSFDPSTAGKNNDNEKRKIEETHRDLQSAIEFLKRIDMKLKSADDKMYSKDKQHRNVKYKK